jgi:hypothetical protein
MATPKLRWLRHRLALPRSSPVLAIASPIPAELLDEGLGPGLVAAEIELPDLSAWPTPLAKADILLRKAAEVEHALMVQYLYARYSLKAPADVADPQQKSSLMAWRSLVFQVSKEEMAHLMVVQNLRLFLALTPTFERDDFPVLPALFPFMLRLERLSQNSLSKYVVAEAPLDPEGVPNFPAIVLQATGAAGMPINRVGVLYALIGVVFASGIQDVEQDASQGDPWYEMVRQLAYLAYGQEPAAAWHLAAGALHPESQAQQAAGSVWVQPPNAGMRVPVITTRLSAKEALRDIGLQGEGPAPAPDTTSHFQRFAGIYNGTQSGTLPFPAADTWATIDVPIDPRISNDGADPNAISDPIAKDWAQLADLRYALLLGFLEQYFLTAPADRVFLRAYAIDEMRTLTALSRKLVTLARSATGGMAALPFTLPNPIHLSMEPMVQWQMHIDRMTAAIAWEDTMFQSHGAGNITLQQLVNGDPAKLDKLRQAQMGGGGGGNLGRSTRGRGTRFDRVRELLNVAVGTAQPYHSGSGTFWNLARADFLQTFVYGLRAVETEGENRGARSNLIKALKGEAPFDGTEYERMPAGRPAMAPPDIAFIENWIDDGCPEDSFVSAAAADCSTDRCTVRRCVV